MKVNHDGFGLGAQRRKIKENDLPLALDIIKKYKQSIIEGKEIEFNLNEVKFAHIVKKEKIAESGDYNLSGDRYKEAVVYNGKWDFAEVENTIEKVKHTTKIKKDKFLDKGKYPIIDQSEKFIAGYWNRKEDVFRVSKPIVIFGDHTKCFKYIDFDFVLGADGVKILKPTDEYDPKFFYFILSNLKIKNLGYSRHYKELKRMKIPLPPLEIQEQIVAELDSYQKIIDGAKQVVENYKPTFKIDPEWEMMKLVKICENLDGKRIPITKSDRKTGPYPYYGASGIVDYTENYIFDEDLLLISEDGANLLARVTPIAFSVSGKVWVNNHAHVLRFENIATQKFVELYINSINIKNYVTGSAQPKLNQKNLNSIMIPYPHIEIRKNIIKKIENEQKAINSNKELITIFENKIKDKIAEVWGEKK